MKFGMRFLFFSFLLVSLLPTHETSAQTAAGTQIPEAAVAPVTVPSDPAELMKLAAQVNGLGAHGMKHWHIKVSYQIFTPKGKIDDEGTLEEWWAEPDKDKIVYAGTKFHRTVYITPSGDYQVGDSGVLPSGLFFVRQTVLYPGLKSLEDDGVVYRTGSNPFKGPELACVDAVLPKGRNRSQDFVTDKYCLRAGTAVLRAHVTSASTDTVYQDMTTLDSRNIAGEITMRIQGKNYLTAKLLESDPLTSVPDSEFDVPSDAVRVEATQVLEASAGLQIRKTSLSTSYFPKKLSTNLDAPSFRSLPRHQHLTVNLAVLIGADGRVQKIESLSGPNAISQAAIEDATKLTYDSSIANKPLTETWLMVDVMSN